jgi:hypothetical protein
MIDQRNARIPDASTAWQLWYSDTFDRESSTSLQENGENILRGLYQLWRYTLSEAIQDNGSASFSYFHLTWGNTAASRIDVDVKPLHNRSLRKLRQWAETKAKNQEESQGIGQHSPAQSISVLSRLAQLHYELLQKSDRWKAASIDWSAEARELLARVESMTDPEDLTPGKLIDRSR